MVQIRDPNTYELLRKLMIKRMKSFKNKRNTNKAIGTLHGILIMNQDKERYVKLGEYIRQGKVTKAIRDNSEQYLEAIQQLAADFQFNSRDEFLAWFRTVYTGHVDISPMGKMKPLPDELLSPFPGDTFDIHIVKNELLSKSQVAAVVHKGEPRPVASRLLRETPLYGWEESINLWTDNIIGAIAVAENYNQWEAFHKAIESLPCGQARFNAIENFLIDMKVKFGLDDDEVKKMGQEFLEEFEKRTLQKLVDSAKPAAAQKEPTEPTDPLEKYTDSTRMRTGRVPNKEGFCLIADYLKKKHGTEIFVSESAPEVANVLSLMTKANPGVKIAIQVRIDQHWCALMIEKRREGKFNLVLMDSLGDGALSKAPPKVIIELFDEFRKKHPDYTDSILYQNIDLVQFDDDNCGTFSIKFCEGMLKDPNFVKKLREEKFVVDDETRKELDITINRDIPKEDLAEVDDLYQNNVISYVLPPKYFAYTQREKYVDYYTRGKKIENKIEEKLKSEKMKDEIRAKMNKNKKYIFTEKVNGVLVTETFKVSNVGIAKNKKTGQEKKYTVNMRMVHFRNKYWEKAITQAIKLPPKEIADMIDGRLAGNLTLSRLNQCVSKRSHSDKVKRTSPLELVNGNVSLTAEQAKREFEQREGVAKALESSTLAHQQAVSERENRKRESTKSIAPKLTLIKLQQNKPTAELKSPKSKRSHRTPRSQLPLSRSPLPTDLSSSKAHHPAFTLARKQDEIKIEIDGLVSTWIKAEYSRLYNNIAKHSDRNDEAINEETLQKLSKQLASRKEKDLSEDQKQWLKLNHNTIKGIKLKK
jgi:hypothetical protein